MNAVTTTNPTPFRFIALIAFLTALVAMSIDAMLPAMGAMATELGAKSANDEQLIIMFYFLGNVLGIPIFGPVSDSYGRKPAIFVALGFYAFGAIMCYFASSFIWLLIGRVVQGFGGAGPRVAAMAMVRDGAKGADMAKIMSFVMSVFMLVPVIAPSIGQLVLAYGTWHHIFLGFIGAAIIAALWLGFGQEETLKIENRRAFSVSQLWSATKEVCSNRLAIGYTVTTGIIFGIFTTYLAVCRRIYVEQYDMGTKFPLIFGGLAICIAIAMVANGVFVNKLGMRKLSRAAMLGYVIIWCVILVLSYFYNGSPPLLILLPCFAIWYFAAGFTFGNFNAIAMEPMGHIAGMASSIIALISQALGIILGVFAGRYYDGSITTIAFIFTIYAVIGFIIVEWAERGRR